MTQIRGIREGIGCEVGEVELWISDGGALRHMTSSHDVMINYHENAVGLLGPLVVTYSRLRVLGTFSFDFCQTQEHLTFSC